MRASLQSLACLVLLASGCIDTPLSLGEHNAAAGPGEDAFVAEPPLDANVPDMMGGQGGGPSLDANVPNVMGGQGGATPTHMFDGGHPPSLCDGATLTAELQCQVQDGFIGPPLGGRPPPPMMTAAVLTVTPQASRPGHADVTGALAFEAWSSSFTGRIEGELDCGRGTLSAFIVDGQFSSPGSPPGPFYGQLDGSLDPFGDGLTGMWWHGPNTQGGPRCVGPWTATP